MGRCCARIPLQYTLLGACRQPHPVGVGIHTLLVWEFAALGFLYSTPYWVHVGNHTLWVWASTPCWCGNCCAGIGGSVLCWDGSTFASAFYDCRRSSVLTVAGSGHGSRAVTPCFLQHNFSREFSFNEILQKCAVLLLLSSCCAGKGEGKYNLHK